MTVRSLINQHRWPWIALGVSIAMLAAAHGFERIGNMLPCPLCLRQREVYWAAIAMVVTGLILARLRPTGRFLMALNVLIGLVFLTGALVAGFHAGVEWGVFPPPNSCSGVGVPFDPMAPIDLAGAEIKDCTAAPFYALGLSMAGWNGVASLIFASLSFWAATRAR